MGFSLKDSKINNAMKLKINNKNIQRAREVIKKGGMIIYPTDTLHGLGGNIFNQQAVKKIFIIKKRSFKKSISVMVSNFEDIKRLAFVGKQQEKIIKKLLPGPYTILLKKKKIVPGLLTAGSDKIGIRIPKSKFCQNLAKDLPITATSANISGEKNFNYQKLKAVDLIFIGGKISGKPSAIIDLTKKPFEIIKR